MAIIDPEGLFHGERLAACSDIAQLYWPRFFVASNGYARLELSYAAIVSKIFASLRQPPEAAIIWGVLEEYAKHCLVILYEHEGVWWAQFDTSAKFLPRFKTVRDEKSPVPSYELIENHQRAYLAWKAANSIKNESFRKSEPDFGTFRMERGGVGIGGGVGEGVEKPSRAKKPREMPTKTEMAKSRHAEFKAAILQYWQARNPGVEMPWGPAEGRNLEMWLRESPTTTVEQFTGYLRHRFRSQINHVERPSRWIGSITNFAAGPIDRFGKPLAGGTNGKPGLTESIAAKQQVLDAREARRVADDENNRGRGAEAGHPGPEPRSERPTLDLVLRTG
jgi:hypothetical protein